MAEAIEKREKMPVQLRLLGMACFALPVTALYVAFVVSRSGEFPSDRLWVPILATPAIAVVGRWVWRYGPRRLLGNILGHLGG